MDKESLNSAYSAAVFHWKPAAWLRVSGEDAATFLQGQLTNDLRGMAPGQAVYGLWLNQKGKVLADSFVLRARGADGVFWVGSYFSTAAVLRERLEAYIVADDVVIEDLTAGWEAVTWLGGASNVPVAPAEAVTFAGRRGRAPSIEWVFPATSVAAVAAACAGTPEIAADEMARRRIDAAIPAVPADIGPGDLPNEGGLEADAISYGKGCYLGQEVMARLKTMGRVRRRLIRVAGDGAAPAVPVELVQGGRRVGELRSVAANGEGFVGLALVTLLNFRADEPLTFSAADGTGRETRAVAP